MIRKEKHIEIRLRVLEQLDSRSMPGRPTAATLRLRFSRRTSLSIWTSMARRSPRSPWRTCSQGGDSENKGEPVPGSGAA